MIGPLLIGGFLLVGLALVGYGGLALRPAVRVARTEPVPVRDLERLDGAVEVVGTAERAESAAVAPFSGRECFACRYEIEEYQQSGKSSHWETLEEGGGGVPFLVVDETGRVRVDPAGADLRFAAHRTRVDPGEEPPQRIARYVAESDAVDANDDSLDLGLLELNLGSAQRFTEYRLDPGETVYVYASLGRPEEPPEWGSDLVDAELGSEPGVPFVISDTTERWAAWRLAKGPLGVLAMGLSVLLLAALFALAVL